jgi:hypothetical protein
MKGTWTIGAQLSTSHSSHGALDFDSALEAVERVRRVIDLGLLIVGSRDAPEIFRSVCVPRRPSDEVFLRYKVLSDINEMENSDLVVNWRGERSRGWGGWAKSGAEVNETFRFVCPNNPEPRRKAIRRLGELLRRYAFAGVFLDKSAFPRPPTALTNCSRAFATTAVARRKPSTSVSGKFVFPLCRSPRSRTDAASNRRLKS